MREINLITLHCSDSDIPEHDNVETIDRWHKQRGWKGIGYHWYIDKKGGLWSGRAESEVGAHAAGYNENSIGICLGGRNSFTEEQFERCASIVASMLDRYNLDIKDVVGHNELNPEKTCPNFPIENVIKRIYGPFRRRAERGED